MDLRQDLEQLRGTEPPRSAFSDELADQAVTQAIAHQRSHRIRIIVALSLMVVLIGAVITQQALGHGRQSPVSDPQNGAYPSSALTGSAPATGPVTAQTSSLPAPSDGHNPSEQSPMGPIITDGDQFTAGPNQPVNPNPSQPATNQPEATGTSDDQSEPGDQASPTQAPTAQPTTQPTSQPTSQGPTNPDSTSDAPSSDASTPDESPSSPDNSAVITGPESSSTTQSQSPGNAPENDAPASPADEGINQPESVDDNGDVQYFDDAISQPAAQEWESQADALPI